MSGWPLLLAGAAALTAAALGAEPAPPGQDGLAALGRSLGGWRVLAVDALYLRAEALRARGRAEEVPPLYRAIVELDPGNEAATNALAQLIAGQIRDGAQHGASPDDLLAWWDEAWRMTSESLAQRPASAGLALRAGDLLLETAASDPRLAAALDARLGGATRREALGVASLLAAARAAESVPRTGRAHLVLLARLAPRAAASALARGASDEQVGALLGAARELATLHPAALAEIELVGAPQPPSREGTPVALTRHLQGNLRLVEEALRWRAGGERAAFDAALAAQAALESTPQEAAVGVLGAWAASR